MPAAADAVRHLRSSCCQHRLRHEHRQGLSPLPEGVEQYRVWILRLSSRLVLRRVRPAIRSLHPSILAAPATSLLGGGLLLDFRGGEVTIVDIDRLEP